MLGMPIGKHVLNLGNFAPIVTIDDFINSYENPDNPHVKRSVGFLKERGSLPLTFESPDIFKLNILAAWLFWSGNISKYIGTAIVLNPEYVEGLEKIAQDLDLRLKRRDNDLAFGKNGALYSRLFGGMGVIVSGGTRDSPEKKSRGRVDLPYYVRFLITKYDNLRHVSKKIATKILSDQCRIFLYSKVSWKRNSYALYLISNQHERNVRNLAQQVVDMFDKIYPKIGLSMGGLKIYKEKGEQRYSGHFNLTREMVSNAYRHYGLVDLTMSTSYHQYGFPRTFGTHIRQIK
jgi:hypothetical protein